MNLDQIKKDLEEFKYSKLDWGIPLGRAYGLCLSIENHLEELIVELQTLQLAIELWKSQIQKAEEVIRFYGDKNNYRNEFLSPTSAEADGSRIDNDCGQKAREYLEGK